MNTPFPFTAQSDPQVHEALVLELGRQESQIELIASENHTSLAVLEALGSPLTNKYAEGYPGRRYYGGCEFVDHAEDLARDRLCQIFDADHANVQPTSGSQANQAALLALADPGDRILAMDLNHGGHLSHGHPKNASGVFYDFSHYGVSPEDEQVDYGALRAQASDLKPKVLLAGASAYPRLLDFEILGEIARESGSLFMVDMAHIAGLVATGQHASPIPHADVVTMTTHKTLRGPRGGAIVCREDWAKKIDSAVFPGIQGGPLMHAIAAKAVAFGEALSPSFQDYGKQVVENAEALATGLGNLGHRLVSGGTDTHLLLVDLRGPEGPGITGRQGEDALPRAGITVNKNLIPFDPEKPMATSGIRMGSPAATTRGFGLKEMELLAGWIDQVLRNPDDEALAGETKEAAESLCASFPVYPELGKGRTPAI